MKENDCWEDLAWWEDNIKGTSTGWCGLVLRIGINGGLF
jgi:hypothetical protein